MLMHNIQTCFGISFRYIVFSCFCFVFIFVIFYVYDFTPNSLEFISHMRLSIIALIRLYMGYMGSEFTYKYFCFIGFLFKIFRLGLTLDRDVWKQILIVIRYSSKNVLRVHCFGARGNTKLLWLRMRRISSHSEYSYF